MARAMTGAEIVIKPSPDQGVEHIFGYPRRAVLPIYDEIFKQTGHQAFPPCATSMGPFTLRRLCPLQWQGGRGARYLGPWRDERGDGAHRRAHGFDSRRLHHGAGLDGADRSDAFQECDTVGITRPCTKHNYLVKDVSDLTRILHEAFYVARTGGQGRSLSISQRMSSSQKGYAAPARWFIRPTARNEGQPPGHPGGGRSDRQRQAAIHGRRRHRFRARCFTTPARTRGPDRVPTTSTLMGLGAYQPPRRSGSGCSACMAPMKRTSPCMIAT